jgi:heptosyltransferase-2/heptosyltransferase-3
MRRLLIFVIAAVGRLFVRRDSLRRTAAHNAEAFESQILNPDSCHGMPRRILVIKPDHLGDLLLATPALRQLRAAQPTAHIVGLVGPWAGFLWRDNPDIDALLELPFPGFERRQGRSGFARFQPYLTLLRYAVLLRAGHFDTALLLRDDHWWGGALALLAGIPTRIGCAHPQLAPLLSTSVLYDPGEHVTDQALRVVERYGSTENLELRTQNGSSAAGCAEQSTEPRTANTERRPAMRYDPQPEDINWAERWLAAHVPPGKRLIVIHPGTGGPTKHWLNERWAEVGDALAASADVLLLLTGGPGEEALIEAVAAQMHQRPLTLAGQTSVSQLTALLRHATLVIGVDSGPLHLAVSQGTRTIHLYGPSDAVRFGPWGDPRLHRVVRAGLWCSPCSVFSACPRSTSPPECMAAITVASVVAASGG